MSHYETSATAEEQGRVHLSGVPFAPGTLVEVTISPGSRSAEEASTVDALAASRERMRELFRTTRGFRMAPRIPREELFDR